jgi:hypothetical protein
VLLAISANRGFIFSARLAKVKTSVLMPLDQFLILIDVTRVMQCPMLVRGTLSILLVSKLKVVNAIPIHSSHRTHLYTNSCEPRKTCPQLLRDGC